MDGIIAQEPRDPPSGAVTPAMARTTRATVLRCHVSIPLATIDVWKRPAASTVTEGTAAVNWPTLPPGRRGTRNSTLWRLRPLQHHGQSLVDFRRLPHGSHGVPDDPDTPEEQTSAPARPHTGTPIRTLSCCSGRCGLQAVRRVGQGVQYDIGTVFPFLLADQTNNCCSQRVMCSFFKPLAPNGSF